MKPNPLCDIGLHIWECENTRNVIAVVIRFPTVPQQVWQFSPAGSNRRLEQCFCILQRLSWTSPPLLSWIMAAFFLLLLFIVCLAPPVPSHLPFELSFTSVSVFILTFPHEAWECQRWLGGCREQQNERTRAALCHSFVLCLRGLLAGLITMWAALWRSAASLRGLSSTVPFFPPVVASHEERDSGEEERFQFTLEQCLCLYSVRLERPLPACAEFEHSFSHLTSLRFAVVMFFFAVVELRLSSSHCPCLSGANAFDGKWRLWMFFLSLKVLIEVYVARLCFSKIVLLLLTTFRLPSVEVAVGKTRRQKRRS